MTKASQYVASVGKDAFHRVPLIAAEVRDAMERVLTLLGCAPLVCAVLLGFAFAIANAEDSPQTHSAGGARGRAAQPPANQRR